MTTRYLINCQQVRVILTPGIYRTICIYNHNYRIDVIKNLKDRRFKYGAYHIMAIDMSTWKAVFDIPFFENRLAKK